MYRKIVWCYIFILTLLDLSLNTKLSAQGKSHGVTVHDSLIEGITFQEWGGGSGGSGGSGNAMSAGALSLSPRALEFGRAELATAHARTVTLTNTANTTMHLASVAGTTQDFHASFFESKTLPPQANTTFTVVYLGRREGPVSAHLYIHTSLGVHKYPVSATGVASEWGLWPLVGVRVPHNATVEPLLTMYNPTDQTIQVSEVYSSGAWLRLALPEGGARAARAAWALAPGAARALVRLRVAAAGQAYVRIRGNMTRGALLLAVEARAAPPGEFAAPLQLRLRARGSRDAPERLALHAGNSAPAPVPLDAAVWARCAPAPPGPADFKQAANGNGGKSDGVHVTLLRSHLDPHQRLARAAHLTLDYAKMWAGYGASGAGAADGAWCGGWVVLGRAAVPYSLRLLPGTLRLDPPAAHFVTANLDEVLKTQELRVHNEFPVAVHVLHVDFGPDVDKYFEVASTAPLVVPAGSARVVARVRVRGGAAGPAHTHLLLRTNVSDYSLPLYLYSGRLDMEWEWPAAADGQLRLGALGASSTRRVRVALRNAGPVALCVVALRAALGGAAAQFALERGAARCVAPGGRERALLTVVACAREAALAGHVALSAAPPGRAHAPVTSRAALSLTVLAGRLHALPLALPAAAPYVWSAAPLVMESTMAVSMRLVDVTLPPDNPAVSFHAAGEGARDISAGRRAVGTVVFAPEKLCEPHCYTGLALDSPEGALWLRRAGAADAAALAADAALARARLEQFGAAAARVNFTLHAHTTRVLQLAAAAAAPLRWPRLARHARARAPLTAVGGAEALRVRVANPSSSRALLLQAVLAPRGPFRLVRWRALRGAAREWGAGAAHALGPLLLAPRAELELKLSFAPREARPLSATLYLRNNLTVLEEVQLSGRGAYPSFEIGGRRPGTDAPLLFEVSECGAVVRRSVVARNTGPVAVRLRDWRVGGARCQARGFRVLPCAALLLRPNESRALTLAFAPDWTLARVGATLRLRSDAGRAAFPLRAAAPARLLPRCAAAAPRPAWEPQLRAAAQLLALAALALVLAAAALDAERELRRARAARPPPAPEPRRPLDLRALAAPPAPPAAVARRAPARRRRAPRLAVDPAAERRAFERWRHEVLRRPGDDERSSDDNEAVAPSPAPPVAAPPSPENDTAEPGDEPPAATDGYDADPETEDRRPGSGDEDAASTGSGSASASSSSPTADVDEPDDDDEPDRSPAREARDPAHGDAAAPAAGPTRASARSRGEAARRFARGDAEARRGGRPARRDKARRTRASPPRSPPRARRAPGALRWGASWSSVVAARAPPAGPAGPAPLAPIGSDVRRRTEPAPADHSLFYFNGDPAPAPPRDPDFAWRSPPQVERPAFSPSRDFLDMEPGAGRVARGGLLAEDAGAFRSVRSVWGGALEPRPAAAAWLWGFGADGAVRPPPGFGATPRPVRPYDPFRSLASIWAPGALDWRADEPAAAPDEPAPGAGPGTSPAPL